MNEFTRDFFEGAISELRGYKREDLRAIAMKADENYCHWRDMEIGLWVDQLLDGCERWDKKYKRLLRLAPKVCAMMEEHARTDDWYPMPDRFPDLAVDMCAFAIAILRWINQDNAGLIPHLEYTQESVAEWYDDRRTYQMSMFSEEKG